MCGIVGWIDRKSDLKNHTDIIEKMTSSLAFRGPDDSNIYESQHVLFGHRRLTVIDPVGGAQPMTKKLGNATFTIVYNGELYNTEDLRNELLLKGYSFNSYSDTEVLLTSYIEWGEACTKHLNGIFAFGIWDEGNKKLFLARDPLGVKPLFYYHKDSTLIFASEIKALLLHPFIEPEVDENGLLEIFGLGPARSPGVGVFKNINEIPPANAVTFDERGFNIKEYWKLQALPINETLDEAVEHTRTLLVDAINRQLVSDVPLCTFLSGGLDSSAISAIAATHYKEKNQLLNTYSIDYVDNEKYFKSSSFQPDADAYWVKRMTSFIGSNHHNVIVENKELATALYNAVAANDLPGMADIDSSLYLFCKEVRKDNIVALSGECADEIFGGYPWYTRIEDINANTFPWSKYVSNRKSILSNELKKLPLEEYVDTKYNETLSTVPHDKSENKMEYRMKEMFFLNIKWFMVTLLNRKDRMSMSNSLEVRVPFADYRIVEYAFNIPYQYKLCDNREKGLLRRALSGILPNDVIQRKKSPYPKTHNPIYTKEVQALMMKVLNNSASPILPLLDLGTIKEIVESGGNSYSVPWYGQLMTGPQLIAFLFQINTWMEKYKVKLLY